MRTNLTFCLWKLCEQITDKDNALHQRRSIFGRKFRKIICVTRNKMQSPFCYLLNFRSFTKQLKGLIVNEINDFISTEN